MFDIDAGYAPIIRLDAPTAISADEEIAAIEKQMEALSLRHCELMEAKRVAFAQSQPIPVSPGVWVEVQATDWSKPIIDEGWMSNDFWDHCHRVLSGTTPMIARSVGHIDRMTAAAAGEIEDPAAGLRRERRDGV